MGFGDKFKEFAKKAAKALSKIGTVSGHAFPVGTTINLTLTDGERSMTFTMPNKEEYVVTHDKVKHAEVLAMGVIEIDKNSKGTTMIHGTKYRVELTDGKVAILTVGLGDTLEKIENIIF